MKLTLALGADRDGFALKEDVLPWPRGLGHQADDSGAHSLDPDDDFPDIAHDGQSEVDDPHRAR